MARTAACPSRSCAARARASGTATASEYLDFLGGLAVTSLGHAHPAVADALGEQARTLLHVSNLYYNELQPHLAQRLDALPRRRRQGVLRQLRRRGQRVRDQARPPVRPGHGGPERFHVLSAYGSFHGRTLTTLAATGQPQKQETFQPLPSGFRQVPFADLDALAAAMDERVCAVLLEAVQGEGGVNPSPPGYLEQVRALCDEREALLIIDEVQTGLGRTGRWFGFEHADGVRPDVVTMAKALGNGVPIGACWARAEVAAAFKPGDHATTFGGQPLATAAALAVLDVMEAEDVPARSARAGERLTKALLGVRGVADVRGPGLLVAAELEPGLGGRRRRGARASTRGLVVNTVTPTALRFAPSLLVTDDEIDEAVAVFEAALTALLDPEVGEGGT